MSRFLVFVPVIALLGGCGTMANMAGSKTWPIAYPEFDPRPYGGVATDAGWINKQLTNLESFDEPWAIPLGVAAVGYTGLIDLPCHWSETR
jgi:hypothetical protein